MIRKALVVVIPLGVAWLVAAQWQDITRYLKIKQVSAGSGHPEKRTRGRVSGVPAPVTSSRPGVPPAVRGRAPEAAKAGPGRFSLSKKVAGHDGAPDCLR